MIFGGSQLKKVSWRNRTASRGGLAKSLAIVCLLGLAVSAPASGPGYLRAVGPAPLRFWSPPKRTPESLATNAVPADASAPAMVPNPNPGDFLNAFGSQPPLVMEAKSSSGPSPMAPVMPSDPNAPANSNVNGSSTAPPGDVVSPQMFLQYFNKNNKRGSSETSIVMPVDPSVIQQNQSPPPPASSATYSH
jgi:hypothetical protein